VSASLWRAGDTDGGATANATYQFWIAAPSQTSIVDECISALNCNGKGDSQQPLSIANQVVVSGAHLGSHIYINASCGGATEPEPYECKPGSGDPNGYAAVVYLYAADLTLEQTAGPSAGGVGGELASAPSISGTSDVTFTATDPGSGVYKVAFSIDGQVVQTAAPDENGGRCKNVGQTTDGLPAFLYLQPCPASVSADLGFDTTRVANGTHHLVVSVIDAAGNAAPVLDRNVTIANPIPPGASALGSGPAGSSGQTSGTNGTAGPTAPNGSNASAQAVLAVSWTATRRERLSTRYGRAQTITGQLTAPGGAPIGGAQIDLVALPSYAGARSIAMPSPYTGQDGRFAVNLPGGISSRTLRFAYRSHLGDTLSAATRTLTLSVEAGIALSISPRTASVGHSIFFRGRLLGGSIPRGGKQLVLEARSPGGSWMEFNVIRADSRGRYRARYRFRFPGPARYQFRVLSEAEAAYPFAPGASNVVGVRER